MEGNFSFRELYDVSLKATYPIEIDGRVFEPGENIAVFDKIQIADFKEDKDFVSARGGYQNADRIIWESTKDVRVNFSQGVFSKTQYGILNNSRVLRKNNTSLLVSKREHLETDENGIIELSYLPEGDNLYVYCESDGIKMGRIIDEENNKKLTIYELSDDQKKPIAYLEVVVDYTFNYDKDVSIMTIGETMIGGFLSLEGKTRVKDDVTGRTVTALIKIPKLKLTSQLSLRLGQGANPVVGYFSGLAIPIGARGNSAIVEIIYLDDDVDADIL